MTVANIRCHAVRRIGYSGSRISIGVGGWDRVELEAQTEVQSRENPLVEENNTGGERDPDSVARMILANAQSPDKDTFTYVT